MYKFVLIFKMQIGDKKKGFLNKARSTGLIRKLSFPSQVVHS
jgi:hypothetical protein